MNDLTLVILAAGIGSRFKGGVKQLTKLGKDKKTIMELSIRDAKEAGFNKVVFIIREELKEDFLKYIIPNIDMDYEFAYQYIDDLPINVSVNRNKPWGTGHALLAIRNIVRGNFVIINADDYYGKESLKKLAIAFKENQYAMIGYKMKNTIFTSSEVNRGICNINNNYLNSIKETYNIKFLDNKYLNSDEIFDPNILVSMNIWGLNSNIFKLFEDEFIKFLKDENNLENKEFLIPIVINYLVNNNIIKMFVIPSDDICTGITYKEDINFFENLIGLD